MTFQIHDHLLMYPSISFPKSLTLTKIKKITTKLRKERKEKKKERKKAQEILNKEI